MAQRGDGIHERGKRALAWLLARAAAEALRARMIAALDVRMSTDQRVIDEAIR